MLNELEAVRSAQRGSQEAFCQLVRAYQAGIHAYLGRFVRDRDTMDDLAQQVFLNAYHRLRSYRGEAPFRAWLFRIARNEALMYLRQEARRRAAQGRSVQAALEGWQIQRLESQQEETPSQEAARLAALNTCLERLPQRSGDLVQNFYFKGIPAADIARRTGMKENAVWVSLLRIRQALRECVRRRVEAPEAL